MKRLTLKRCYRMLTELDNKYAFISFFFKNKFITFPTYKFKDYKNKSISLDKEIIETCQSLNEVLKHKKLNFIEIITSRALPALSREISFDKKELDQYIIKILNDLLVEKRIKQI